MTVRLAVLLDQFASFFFMCSLCPLDEPSSIGSSLLDTPLRNILMPRNNLRSRPGALVEYEDCTLYVFGAVTKAFNVSGDLV